MANPVRERGTWAALVGGIPVVLGAWRGVGDVDAVARQAAVMLSEAFPGRDVELRFNTDGRSGGAFVDGVLKLGCALYKQRPEGLTDEEWWDYAPRAELPDVLVIEVGIMSDISAYRVEPNHEGGFWGPYYHSTTESLESGLAFLLSAARGEQGQQ